MTVLLVNPPSTARRSDGTTESFIQGQKRRLTAGQYYSLPIEHLGIMSIAAYMRSRGIEVDTVNGMVAGHASVEKTWQSIRAVTGRRGRPPALVGFSNIDTLSEVLWLANRCRRQWPEARLALGNVFATLNFQRVLNDHECFDYAIVGEGEVSFTRLADVILNGGAEDTVPGLAWRMADGSVSSTPPTAVSMDELPWPSRDELPTVLKEGFAGAVFTTRGCLYRCTFCGTGAASDLLGRNRYRGRSIENVVDEIEYLMKDFGTEFLSISDDLFLAKHPSMQERAASFADEIIRRKLRITFMIDARVDSFVDLSLLAHLKQAGLRRVFVGLETGSYEQLVSYGKRHVGQGEDPVQRVNAVQELGVEVIPGTIMFHPTVRPPELRETLRLLKATGYRNPNKLLDRVTAYAGTPLYYEYAAKGYLTNDWPVGEWNFIEPAADEAYHKLVRRIRHNQDIDFDDATDHFLSVLAEWDEASEPETASAPTMGSHMPLRARNAPANTP